MRTDVNAWNRDDRHCALCRRPLPPDTRWKIIRLLSPRFPRCEPATEECYRGLAQQMGFTPSDEDVRRAVADARRM